MRIFQLAQELNINSQEILDALDDMGIQAKSNLAVLEDNVVAELRELFKPKPKSVSRSAKDDAVRKALAEREARDRAARDAARREEERKSAARRTALERAAARRAPGESPLAQNEAVDSTRFTAAEHPDLGVENAPSRASAVPEPPLAEDQASKRAAQAADGALIATAKAESELAPVAPEAERKATASHAAPVSRLGKAVIAPPPSTARERAEMLGRPLSQVSQPQRGTQPAPANRRSTPPAPRQAPPQRPRGPAQPPPIPAPAARHIAHQTVPAPRVTEVIETPIGEVKISDGIVLKDLAERMSRKAKDIIKRLFLEKGIMATINHALDEETARWVVEAFGGTAVVIGIEAEAMADVTITGDDATPEQRIPRPPVVTMMGHVDHGKTSLLDAIRKTRVAEREAGGITQHIGAYKVTQVREGKEHEIVFLDTPGHEAFTLMRARGARITDIVVLVVAADDGIMPQTVEAIHHAKAAGVPIIVAINKIDKPGANPDKILQQLTEHEILVEQFGGETVAVPVSAKTYQGIDNLLEMVLLVAEIQQLTSIVNRPASGTVLEAKLDRSRGPVATVLVQNGDLKVGDVFVAGSTWGRVRALADERDRRIDKAGPSTPVVIMGLEEVPQAGDTLQVFTDEQKARQIAMWRQAKDKEATTDRHSRVLTLETLHKQIKEGQVNELPVVLKGDVQGSVEVLAKALTDLSTTEVKVKVIHTATGAITETDVMLAAASRAIIIGFNIRPERNVIDVIRREGVDVRLHSIIYKVTEEIKQAMLATLSPVEKEVYLGRAEVREVYRIVKVGDIGGCYVVDGLIRRDSQVRLLRDNVVVWTGKLASLRRFKDDAREVKSGFECGIGLERYNDLKVGDEIESFMIELSRRDSLDLKATR
ncbi:MAG: translation initiation factor IF-2 [Acidobacteriota bacterium]